MNVLVLNAGSSSLKFQIISTDPDRIAKDADERLTRGEVERIGGEAIVTTKNQAGERRKNTAQLPDITAAIRHVKAVSGQEDIHAVGHRIVHGGERFTDSVLITPEVLEGIEGCIDLAPLHNPTNLKGIAAATEVFGRETPQVAVFDTGFHSTLPEHAYLYAIPYHLYRRHGIRRYGFHGTSHRYVAHRYRRLRGLTLEQTNIITLHLGNGCSAAAIRSGRSVDTSMGMTPLEGLVMGSRSGDLDPTIVDVIATKEGLSIAQVETMLNTQSGLLGISGLTNDMRVLLEESSMHEDHRVLAAIDVFCYRARKYIGAYLAAMGGADAVVFTGGIGENSPAIREQICTGLEWTGLRLDRELNHALAGKEGAITAEGSRLMSYVIPTDEELLIARDTVRIVLGVPHPS
ncbi:MAG: acetate kinase [Bryobacterales bacterium]|nr:acetate kinase [Bryobacterales bacterium]